MAIIPDPSGDAPLAPYVNYDEIGTVAGVTSYQFYITGAGTSNYSSRTIRYKLDDDEWTYSMNHSFVREDSTTRLELSRPQGKSLTVEAWTTDEMSMLDSLATTVIIDDNEIYTSKLYVPSSTGTSKKPKKLFVVRHNYFNVLSEVPRDAAVVTHDATTVTVTKGSSGSGSYTWAMFPIEGTDELINKRITVSGSFITSGSFTSGVRLWWMNTSNTGIKSGPVNGIEFIGNQGNFSVSGIVPSRPADCGKLALLVYANISSAAQGVSSTYSNLKIALDTKNLLKNSQTRTNTGITTTCSNNHYAISGTASGTWPSLTENLKCDVIPPNTPITFATSSGFASNQKLYTRFYKNSGLSSYNGITLATDSPAGTVIFPDDSTYGFQLFLNTTDGAIVNKEADIMIHKGMNELTGPNLINMYNAGSGTGSGLTWTTYSDGRITITGTNNNTSAFHIKFAYTIPEAYLDKTLTMYFTGRLTGIDNVGLKTNTTDVGGVGVLGPKTMARTFVATSSVRTSVTYWDLYISTTVRTVDADFRFFLKEGSCAKDFSPYAEKSCLRVKKLYTSINGVTKLVYKE